MRRFTGLLTLLAMCTVGCTGIVSHRVARDPVPALETRRAVEGLIPSVALDEVVEEACRRMIANHPEAQLDMNHVWAAVIDFTNPDLPLLGAWNGDEQVYPASVIKAVFMVHIYQRVLDGDLRPTRRVRRLMREMIRVSSNRATQGIVDILSGVEECTRIDDPAAYASWCHRRNATNRYMRSLGFTRMNANQKTWDELPAEDSIELQFLGDDHPMGFSNGNRLTATETAALMWLIDEDLVVSVGACEEMRDLLERRGHFWRYGDELPPIAMGMPRGTRNLSKSGATDRFRHDAGTVALPDGRRLALAIFTDAPLRREDFNAEQRNQTLATWAQEVVALTE